MQLVDSSSHIQAQIRGSLTRLRIVSASGRPRIPAPCLVPCASQPAEPWALRYCTQ